MPKSNLPQFRLCKVFTIGDDTLDTAFIADLVKNRGFSCEQYAAKPAKATAPKVKRKKRRKARTPLTAERIREFRKARESGKSYRRIASIFGVSDGRAWQIINRGK
jgi:hypothetical protein